MSFRCQRTGNVLLIDRAALPSDGEHTWTTVRLCWQARGLRGEEQWPPHTNDFQRPGRRLADAAVRPVIEFLSRGVPAPRDPQQEDDSFAARLTMAHRYLLAVVLSLSAALLAGCSGGNTETTASTSSPSAGQVGAGKAYK